ncbi:MAG: methionine--tRNA ligase subunit beta [Candidatus Latescibacteria bacterium]|nr:methionine--tRNA ligase subunit beta [Candidatus Latescibacterota bacterium]
MSDDAKQDETPAPEEIGIEEFARLDLRIARVVRAEPHPNADRLLKLAIDLGGEERQIVAGIAERYRPEDLEGRLIAVVANLKPVKLRGEESRGMLLAASDAPKGGEGERNVVVVTPMSPIDAGSVVS